MNILSVISASRRRFVYDDDAAAYIDAVQIADTQPLETAVKLAINTFILGCKSDGVWTPIKAGCLLVGARTLTGALVPLVGSAPTSTAFASGDYNRKTGLKGDGTSKYINSNRNNNADPQDSNHNYVRVTEAPSAITSRVFIGSGSGATGTNVIRTAAGNAATLAFSNRNATATAIATQATTTGGKGTSRAASSGIIRITGGSTGSTTSTSQTPENSNVCVFGLDSGSRIDARMAVYTIGESIDLALLDARVTTLLSDLNIAIP